MVNMVVDIIVPVYNVSKYLNKCIESLLAQTYKYIKIILVDDGSTDDTEQLVKGWMEKDNGFEIQYIYKENGGMHTAHNMAYENITTELNVCVDSDDCMAEDGVAKILKKWDEVKDSGYAGIIGLDADMNGKIIGKSFPKSMKETTLMGYYAMGGAGDKKLVYRTDIIKKYPPYPVFEGEKYVALAYKYRLIDQDYKLAVLPQILCNVEYQEDGSSGTMWKQYLKNPKGFAFWRKICMRYPESRKRKIVDCIHYCSSSQIAKDKWYIRESPAKFMTFLCSPLGVVLTMMVKHKARK